MDRDWLQIVGIMLVTLGVSLWVLYGVATPVPAQLRPKVAATWKKLVVS